jgi:hypothetical protein
MRLNVIRPAVAVVLASVVGTGLALAQITAVPPASYNPPALGKAAAVNRLLSTHATSRLVALPAPATKERDRLKSINATPPTRGKLGLAAMAAGKGRPLAVGFGRELPAGDRFISGADLQWESLPDGGQAARIEVSSPEAAAVRIALRMGEADPDIALRFVGSEPGASVFGPYPANRIAEEGDRHGVFWSPILEGSTGTIEVFLPAGVPASAVRLNLVRISHLVVAGSAVRKLDPKITGIGGSDFCEIDVVCVATQTPGVTEAAKSVARIIFTDPDGTSAWCTGTLLNDSRQSLTPYLFTASHCINSQHAATTLNLYWFFDALTCGDRGEPPYVLQESGAKLLGRSDDWDWALLRLNAPPPPGVTFAAWRAEALSELAVTTTIHHPQADLKKWSQGSSQGFRSYPDGSSFIEVRYTQGSTEGGSSGSALMTYNTAGGYFEVRGGLYGGDASCRLTSGYDIYSRLDNALPLLRQYLTPDVTSQTSVVPVVEFYNADLQHYFISSDPAEINDLDTGLHVGWERTGLRFLAFSNPGVAPTDAMPVCRFYEKPGSGDSHFYSASPSECTATLAKFGDRWVYESPNVFYVQVPDSNGVCPANSRPIWRYFNAVTTNHRYTVEVEVRDDMRSDPDTWVFEGDGPLYPVMCSPLQ